MAIAQEALQGKPEEDFSDKQRREVILYAQELGITRAAEIVGVPKGTVVAWCQAAGVSTSASSKSQTQAGTAALQTRMEERKMLLAHYLMSDAERLREQLWEPTCVYTFDKDGVFHTGELDEPTFKDKQAILTSIAIIVDKVQLMTGQATARVENLGEVSKEQALDALSELSARRKKLEGAA